MQNEGGAWELHEMKVYCPPPGLNGPQVMESLEKFLADHPGMIEKPYGDVMAASLGSAFPCQTQDAY